MPAFPLDPSVPRIIVDVKISGPKIWRIVQMVLDTGASLCTVSFDTALAVGCNPATSRRRLELMTASSTEVVPLITIPSIQTLGYTLNKVEVACLTLPPDSPVDGLLGLNFLRHFDLHLNFRSGSLEMIR